MTDEQYKAFNTARLASEALREAEMLAQIRICTEAWILVRRYPNDEHLNDLRKLVDAYEASKAAYTDHLRTEYREAMQPMLKREEA